MAEKFLHKPGIDNSIKSKRILNIGDILFELYYDEKGTKRIEKLMFRHGRDEGQYEYGEESGGTRRFIELLDVILNGDEEKVFVIDELDRSLHPQMAIKFVELFLEFSKKKLPSLLLLHMNQI